MSTYAYVNGRPLTVFDPFGLFGFPEHVSITNTAVGSDPFFPNMGLEVANVDFLPDSQLPVNAYWHAMSDGADGQTVGQAQQLYEQYLNAQIASCPWAGGLPSLSHVEGDFAPTDAELSDAVQKARDILARFKQQCPCMSNAKPSTSPAPGDPGSPGNTD
jgi:hypothetical protein